MYKLFTLMLAMVFISFGAVSQTNNNPPSYFANKEGAIRGFDPVAYFTEQKAVKGSSEFSHEWKGVTWYFASDSNKKSFVENPEKFAPQFGGYCAYGVSEDHKSPTDPLAFTIVNNKLYLNYSNKVKELWMKQQPQRIEKANELWPALSTSN